MTTRHIPRMPPGTGPQLQSRLIKDMQVLVSLVCKFLVNQNIFETVEVVIWFLDKQFFIRLAQFLF